MSFATALLMPLVLLFPAAGAIEAGRDVPVSQEAARQDAPLPPKPQPPRVSPEQRALQSFERWPMQFVSYGFRPDSVWQVRIEQQMTIRISPRSRPVQPNAFVGVPSRSIGPRFAERRIGKCLPVARISGVQANGGGSLILYLRDRRIIRADLERGCRSRDFYSGFYLSRSNDGNLCVNRDTLQSRSGANCKLTRMRQLVELDD